MRKLINGLLLTLITLITFSCSDVPSPYDVNEGGNNTPVTGEGTKEKPYDVASASTKQDGSEAWVTGYIVGSVNEIDIKTSAVFAAPFKQSNNILIAASKDEKDYKKCLAVQLYDAVKTNANLVDHADNLGKIIVISGKLTKYFGVSGLKECKAAILDGKDISGTNPQPPIGDALFSETFEAGIGQFIIKDVTLPTGSTFVWKHDATNKYMKASSFVNKQNLASESWLISPSIDLTKQTDATLTFDHAGNFAGDHTKELTLWISEAGKNTWEQVIIPTYPLFDKKWVFVSSGAINLKAYAGKAIQIAFKYISNTTNAATWEIKNVRVEKGAKETKPTEPTEPSGNDFSVYKGIESWADQFTSIFEATTKDPNIAFDKTIKHSGAFSIKHTTPVGTGKSSITQIFPVTPGKKYKITIWYLDNDANAQCRLWAQWMSAAGTKIPKVDLDKLQYPNNAGKDYFPDSAEWQTYTTEVTAPIGETEALTAGKLCFEVRTYPANKLSGSVYYDDIEVVEVK